LHPLVLNGQLLIQAFTGHWQATHDLLDSQAGPDALLPPASISMWRLGLQALETRTSTGIAAARESLLAVAPRNPGLSVYGIMIAGALGDTDTGYKLLDGLLLRRGAHVTKPGTSKDPALMVDPGWRETQWLYTPATASLRADPRFEALAEAIGLAEYWRDRGRLPDERQPTA